MSSTFDKYFRPPTFNYEIPYNQQKLAVQHNQNIADARTKTGKYGKDNNDVRPAEEVEKVEKVKGGSCRRRRRKTRRHKTYRRRR